jgi:hypothetical protein
MQNITERMAAQLDHFNKYEAAAQRLDVEKLKAALPFSEVQIRKALAAGDLHLNTLAMARWDFTAGGTRFIPTLFKGMFEGRNGSSLAERVCVLKHVARHHVAGQPAPSVEAIEWDRLAKIARELADFRGGNCFEVKKLALCLVLAVNTRNAAMLPGFDLIHPALTEMQKYPQSKGRELALSMEYLRCIV